jgi:hypothetical protein
MFTSGQSSLPVIALGNGLAQVLAYLSILRGKPLDITRVSVHKPEVKLTALLLQK